MKTGNYLLCIPHLDLGVCLDYARNGRRPLLSTPPHFRALAAKRGVHFLNLGQIAEADLYAWENRTIGECRTFLSSESSREGLIEHTNTRVKYKGETLKGDGYCIKCLEDGTSREHAIEIAKPGYVIPGAERDHGFPKKGSTCARLNDFMKNFHDLKIRDMNGRELLKFIRENMVEYFDGFIATPRMDEILYVVRFRENNILDSKYLRTAICFKIDEDVPEGIARFGKSNNL